MEERFQESYGVYYHLTLSIEELIGLSEVTKMKSKVIYSSYFFGQVSWNSKVMLINTLE